MKYEAVIFDLDGTLIDSRRDLAEAVNVMRKHYNLEPLSIETVVSYIGDGVSKLVERSIAGTGIDLAEAIDVKKKAYAENLVVHTVFYEGVLKMLDWLKSNNIKIALASNKPVEFCRVILEDMKVSQYFDAVYGGCDDFPLKPAGDMVQIAANAMNVSTEKCIVVGDNWTDIEAGKNCGCFTCFYPYGMGKLTEVQPDAVFENFDELVEIFGKKFGFTKNQ